MLSYRHGFHAGNFADVFKHVLLVCLLDALRAKDKPFRVLDTHAGAGRYDLHAAPAQKNREFANGIGRLWDQTEFSPALERYLAQVRALNRKDSLRWYPGSPRIARNLLRPQDRLVAIERHPAEYPFLAAEFSNDRQVTVQQGDGYAALAALLPPPERRGLVLLDPAYEARGEFDRLLTTVQVIHRRWATGIIAIWYPILGRTPSLCFQQSLQELGIPGLLCAELGLYPYDGPLGLQGCGMLIYNPPWRLAEDLQPVLSELLNRLRVSDLGQTRLEWLAPAL